MSARKIGWVRGGVLGLLCSASVWGGSASAQPAAAYPSPAFAAGSGCCVIPVGTPVAVQLVDPIGTKETASGTYFALKLAAPVIVDGQVVLPAGTSGVGRVVQSAKPGAGGKAAKLVLSAEYLNVPGGALPLRALKLVAIGKDQSMTANASSIGGLLFMPLGMIGFAVTGGDIEIPAGTAAAAKIGLALRLDPVAPAGPRDVELARAMTPPPEAPPGSFVLPEAPPGMGQVVFFRRKTVLGTAQWFNVRDEGQALGKLDNGAFFVVPVSPGIHSFTAQTEPEFKDLLALKIDPGETYFVEGILTKGVVIGVPNLTPSDRARFDELSSQMKAATGSPDAQP